MVVRELVTLLGFELNDAPLKQYDRQIDTTKDKTNGLAKAASGVGTAWKLAAAAVVFGVGWITKNIIDATVEYEAYRTQLQAFTGDADSAARVLSELRDKTSDALFGTGTLVNAYKQMRTLGMGAEDTSRMIDVLGDVANGSAENFNALSGVLARVSTSGKVNAGTMRQLAMAGFGVQDMAQGLGITVEQLNRDIEAGRIGFDELTRAMEGSTREGGRFYMNMANQAMTLGGSIKILKSNFDDLRDAIGEQVAPALASMISYVNEFITLNKTGIIQAGGRAFNYLIHIIAQTIIFFEVLNMRMEKYGGSFTALKGIFADVFDFFRSVVQSAWPALMNLAQLILVAFKPLRAFVQPILEALKPIIQTVFGMLSRFIERLIPIVNGLTPAFGAMGRFIGGLIGPILAVAAAIRGVNAAIAITKGVIGVITSLKTAFALLAGTMSVMRAAAEGNRLAMLMLELQLIKVKIATIAKTVATKAAAIATKLWSAAQAILNVIMTANPIGLIIVAVAALIAIIVLVVKNFDKISEAVTKAFSAIGNFFKNIGSAIGNFFKALWTTVVNVFKKIGDFVKNNMLNIINVIVTLIFFPVGVVMAVVRLIIKHWDTIKVALTKVFTFVADKARAIFGRIVDIARSVVQRVTQVWQTLTGFFSRLWEGIRTVAGNAWEGIKTVSSNAWEGIKTGATAAAGFIRDRWEDIKNAGEVAFNFIDSISGGALSRLRDNFFNTINRIKDFFAGLWEAIKQGPSEALEYIKNAFFGVFDSIMEKFFGFINVIQAGWERVKGFFGGIGQGIANFFTGGGNDSSTSTEPATTLTSGAVQSAASSPVYNNGGSTTNTVNANASINVNVPAGTSAEQARVIAQQVDQAVQDSFSNAIGGARGTIPSPEARRN